MRDLLSIKDLSKEEIISLLDLADDVKKSPAKYANSLTGKSIALLFEKTSTRTRISFEVGMYQLGGQAIYLDWRSTNLQLGALPDEIRCISDYVDLIMARVFEHEQLAIMRDASQVPIINGLSDIYHPCQILSDLMTIREKSGSLDDIRVAFIGDGNNVCNSLVIGCVKLGIPIFVATPKNFQPHEEVIKWIEAQKLCQFLKISDNPSEVVEDANILYTDTWISMGQEAETEERLKIFKPYQINSELLKSAKRNPFIMHCLPAHRGFEITDEVLDSKNSIVFLQAENRLHLQKALMLKILEKQ